MRRVCGFVLILVGVALSIETAHAIRHACKDCSNDRRRYVNSVLFDLCFSTSGLLYSFSVLVDRRSNLLSERARLTDIYTRHNCPQPTRRCARLEARIERINRALYAIELALLRLYERVKRDCDRSRLAEDRKQCLEREAPKYCDAVDNARTEQDKMNSAYLAVVQRCADLNEEKENRSTACAPPTNTPIPATPTPTETPTPTDTPPPPPTNTPQSATATPTPLAATPTHTPLPTASVTPDPP